MWPISQGKHMGEPWHLKYCEGICSPNLSEPKFCHLLNVGSAATSGSCGEDSTGASVSRTVPGMEWEL
jgi:hypothetical protein